MIILSLLMDENLDNVVIPGARIIGWLPEDDNVQVMPILSYDTGIDDNCKNVAEWYAFIMLCVTISTCNQYLILLSKTVMFVQFPYSLLWCIYITLQHLIWQVTTLFKQSIHSQLKRPISQISGFQYSFMIKNKKDQQEQVWASVDHLKVFMCLV